MKSKKIFMFIALLIVLGIGISYQNCGVDLHQSKDSEQNLNAASLLGGKSDNSLVLKLQDGTTISLNKIPEANPMTLLLKDGTSIKLKPRKK